MTEIIDAKFTEEPSTALAVAEASQAPATLFGTDDPVEVIAKATRIAKELKKVIDQCGLVMVIKGKQHVKVEGWLTLASMLNLSPVNEWTRPTESPDGWEAACLLKNGRGEIIARGEASCGRDEGRWKTAENYAIRSMAQTRAQAKAISSKLRFVMVLAGYQATPAEEMPESQPAPLRRPPQEHKLSPEQARNKRTAALLTKAKALGVEVEFGVPVTDGMTFLAWIAANVAGCDDAAKGWKPSDAQITAVEVALEGLEDAQ